MGTIHNIARRSDANTPNDGGTEPPDMEITERVIRLEEKVTGMDKRLDLVEKDLRELARKVDVNFIITWGGLIVLGVGLAGLLAKGFHWM